MGKPAWKQYQEDVAEFYRSLGLDAQVEEVIEGVRGRHEIDIAVRGRRAGMEFLWVVECKAWKSNIPKEKVMALASIVDDVGADRGLLLSEKGFQAGAINAAHRSQVKLTSLAELRVDANDEVTAATLAAMKRQAHGLLVKLDDVVLTETTRNSRGASTRYFTPKNWDHDTYMRTLVTLTTIRDSILRVELGVWPAPYAFNNAGDRHLVARTADEFIEAAGGRIATIDELLRNAVVVPRESS